MSSLPKKMKNNINWKRLIYFSSLVCWIIRGWWHALYYNLEFAFINFKSPSSPAILFSVFYRRRQTKEGQHQPKPHSTKATTQLKLTRTTACSSPILMEAWLGARGTKLAEATEDASWPNFQYIVSCFFIIIYCR